MAILFNNLKSKRNSVPLYISLFVVAFMLPFFCLSAQNNHLNLRFSSISDTVYKADFIIKGAVDKGSVVSINNNSVKVYKTGSFGYMTKLSQGNNSFVVKAVNGTLSSEKTINVFYSTDKKLIQSSNEITPIDTVFTVVSKEGAFLNYSSGQDRLGGAKINFIDDGIILNVVQQYGELYKVALTDNRFVYIPIEYAEVASRQSVVTNSSSWSVSNKGKYDRVVINIGAKQPYTIHQEVDPMKISIDFYGVRCNSNWITQYLDLEAIDKVDFEQVETDVLRAIIYLKGTKNWGFRVSYSGTNVFIDVKHSPEPTLRGMVIGVDAGHGGASLGAVSTSGILEKDLNLDMAYLLKNELEKRGARVVLSRKDDSELSMKERKKIFLDSNIDLLISIHCNAASNDPFVPMGASTYYKHIHNRDLAKSVLESLLELDGVNNYGLVGNFNFSLNGPTEYPNLLMETMFLSSFPDEEKIADPSFRKALVKKAVKGLSNYVKMR